MHIPQVEQGDFVLSVFWFDGSINQTLLADLQLATRGVQRHQVVTGQNARRPQVTHRQRGVAWPKKCKAPDATHRQGWRNRRGGGGTVDKRVSGVTRVEEDKTRREIKQEHFQLKIVLLRLLLFLLLLLRFLRSWEGVKRDEGEGGGNQQRNDQGFKGVAKLRVSWRVIQLRDSPRP